MIWSKLGLAPDISRLVYLLLSVQISYSRMSKGSDSQAGILHFE